jgi:hypothetical protein
LTCPSLQWHKPFWKDILAINMFCKTLILHSIDTVNIKHPIYCTLYLYWIKTKQFNCSNKIAYCKQSMFFQNGLCHCNDGQVKCTYVQSLLWIRILSHSYHLIINTLFVYNMQFCLNSWIALSWSIIDRGYNILGVLY